MQFELKSKADNDIYNCFLPIRKNFDRYSKSAKKQLAILINNVIVFYKVYDAGRFIGCLFVDEINEVEKVVFWGGFAHRHVNTAQSIREFLAFIRHHYPDYTIKAITKHKAAKISLARAGLEDTTKGGYIYVGR